MSQTCPIATSTSPTDCASLQAQEPSQWHANEVATNIATAIILITATFYFFNIGCLIFRNTGSRRSADRDGGWPGLAVNPLSALLAAVIGLVFVFATSTPWPQPLEAAGLLLIVLAQASVLGWQDHDHESLATDLAEKFPDVLSVIVSAYALGDARNKYIELTCNEFQVLHDPWNMMIIAYALTGAGTIAGVIQEVWISKHRDDDEEITKKFSALFSIIQVGTTIASIIFGQSTIAEGCRVFNITKVCAMAGLVLGCFYSLLLVFVRPLR